MTAYPDSLSRLVESLKQLPGVGSKTAERLAFHLVNLSDEEAMGLARAIRDVKQNLTHCSRCFNFTENDPCPICSDAQRDQSVVCVVETPKDLMAFEKAASFKGVYHCLNGHIAPLEGIEPEDLTIAPLLKRAEAGTIKEIILATSPDLEGEGTAVYLRDALHDVAVRKKIKLTRIARGVPAGAEIENVSGAILTDALSGRQAFEGGR
ncbi:MAG: recombination protein RecR [Planctomycetes bacterium]|nr:recombination protein RecR [Planctomycetota bacterium]